MPKGVYERPKVSHVRKVCEMLEADVSIAQISRDTGFRPKTIHRWRDDPDYREATYEFDSRFAYDPTDLLDRSVVAHELCKESSVLERLELLFAVVGHTVNIEPAEKHGYGRSYHRIA